MSRGEPFSSHKNFLPCMLRVPVSSAGARCSTTAPEKQQPAHKKTLATNTVLGIAIAATPQKVDGPLMESPTARPREQRMSTVLSSSNKGRKTLKHRGAKEGTWKLTKSHPHPEVQNRGKKNVHAQHTPGGGQAPPWEVGRSQRGAGRQREQGAKGGSAQCRRCGTGNGRNTASSAMGDGSRRPAA